jgi:hypothetical protein
MKTLKQLQEGVIASADYKLSKSGKRYKAHRKLVETSNPYADILEAMGYEAENKKRLKQIAATAKNAQVKSSEPHMMGNTQDQETVSEEANDAHYSKQSQKMKDAINYHLRKGKGYKDAVEAAKKYVKEDAEELDEARGRPKKMSSTNADDSDEHDDHGEDNGMEADQHIHVQLKKAADSDMKPFHVTFKNGKKHPVPQHVAKTILSATERLKPEHRKNVHDEIHKSHENLLAVHKMIAGK